MPEWVINYGTFPSNYDHKTSVQLSQEVMNQERCVVDVCLYTVEWVVNHIFVLLEDYIFSQNLLMILKPFYCFS